MSVWRCETSRRVEGIFYIQLLGVISPYTIYFQFMNTDIEQPYNSMFDIVVS